MKASVLFTLAIVLMAASTDADASVEKMAPQAAGAAQQVASAFRQRFGADLPVHFENYPPTPTQAALARAATLLQYATIAFALAGQQICEALGMTSLFSPTFFAQLAEKRFSLVIGAFFFGNTIINSIVSTGAFEVLYGPEVIFSKLNTGRMPQMNELLTTVQEAITAATQ